MPEVNYQYNPVLTSSPEQGGQKDMVELTLERYYAQDMYHRAIFNAGVVTGKAKLIEKDLELLK